MDSRVTGLIGDMQSGRLSNPDGSLDCDALNDRIKALHPQLEDEESRVELIALHDALMRTSDKLLVDQGRDPGPLREEWRRTHLAFILAESLTGGEVDGAKLARVNAREIAAGRLHPDESVQVRRLDPEPPEPQASPGLMRKAARGFSRLFGGGGTAAPVEPPQPEPAAPPTAAADADANADAAAADADANADAAAALERAYRAILLWDEEKMRPRLDALAEAFRERLQWLELQPGEDLRTAAERETLEIARWFEENETAFVTEAVSYLGDDILQGLKALGVDVQFGQVIWDAVGEARADLARRLGEAREAACAQGRADDRAGAGD